MTEREKVIELAKRLGVVKDGIYLFDEIALVAFYHIAQKEILEQAAELVDERFDECEPWICGDDVRQLIKE